MKRCPTLRESFKPVADLGGGLLWDKGGAVHTAGVLGFDRKAAVEAQNLSRHQQIAYSNQTKVVRHNREF